MKTIKWTFLVNITVISLFAISTSGCSIIENHLKQKSIESVPPEDSTEQNIKTGTVKEQEEIRGSTSPGQVRIKADVLRQMNCRQSSETDYIYGIYQVGWTAKGDRYEGILKMNGNVGQMRLKFFNSAINSEDLVDQTMVLATCPQGLILVGFNPTDPNTKNKHSFYVADNIFIRRETNGAITLVLIDDQGVTSPLEIQKISN